MGFNFSDYPEDKSESFDFSQFPTEDASEPEDNRSTLDIVRDALDVRNMPKNIMAGLQKVDEYTGAPVRKFFTEAVTGRDMDHAPTGKEQAGMMGLSDKTYSELLNIPKDYQDYIPGGGLTPSGVMGFGLDVVQDPLLIAGALKEGATALARAGVGAGESFVKGGFNSANKALSSKFGEGLEYAQKANVDEINSAAKNLGINEVPKGVTSSNPTFQQTESGLSQSGSFPAIPVRNQYNNFFEGIKKAGADIEGLKSPDSPFKIGGDIQKDLSGQITSSREPVSQMYKDLVPHMQKIEVNPNVVNKSFGVLKRDPVFLTKDGQAMLEEYKQIVMEQPELASLKELRSTLHDSLGPSASSLDRARMDKIYDAVTSVRDNSIEALKVDLPKSAHVEVDDLISQISLADSAHASNMNDINSIKGLLGNKEFKSPSGFLDKLGGVNEADLAAKAGNLDVSSLRRVQEKFPSIFEKAKQAKLNEMVKNSTNAVSGFNDAQFIKQYEGMAPELKELLFTPQQMSQIDSLKTLRRETPAKLGPSGTPGGIFTMDRWSPSRNALDYGAKKSLDMASQSPKSPPISTPAAIQSTSKDNPLLKLIYSSSKMTNASELPRTADKQDTSMINKDSIMQKAHGSKYAQVLQQAAAKGDQSLAAAHFVLSSRDPEYKKTLGED